MVSNVLKMAKESGAKMVDFRFVDMPGMWQHFSSPIHTLDEDTFEEGVGFDGSSIRGFQSIDQSDMLLIPDPETAFMDPFMKIPTLALICDIKDPVTLELYGRDPRYIAPEGGAIHEVHGHRGCRVFWARGRVFRV